MLGPVFALFILVVGVAAVVTAARFAVQPRERTLAILRRPDGFAIVVRAGRNLLRPSHLFVHLKQGNVEALRAVASSAISVHKTSSIELFLRAASSSTSQ